MPLTRRHQEDANHKNYRRVHLMGVSRHTASMFYSPVSFALRTLPLRRSESERRIAHEEKVNEGIAVRVAKEERRQGLRQHLLCLQIAAEGDTAAERDRGKVAALGAFAVRP